MSACLYDVNIWIALAFSSHPHHSFARAEFEQANSAAPAAFCRATQQSFLRITTTPAVHAAFGSPTITNIDAWSTFQELLALPQVVWLEEPSGLSRAWIKLAGLPTASPKVWMDAYLGAFAQQSDISLTTFDRDFTHFQGVTVRLLPIV